MAEKRSQVITFKTSPALKKRLRETAAQQTRTVSNLLEVMALEWCDRCRSAIQHEDAPPHAAISGKQLPSTKK